MSDLSTRIRASQPTTVRPDVGAGFKAKHFEEIQRGQADIGWFEVHAENYMVEGGVRLAMLEALGARWPISLHGVALNLGGAEPLDLDHLKALAALEARFKPRLVSEHIAWSSWQGYYFADLLPLPSNQESLDRLVGHVDQVQQVLQRQILLENPSHYFKPRQTSMPEVEFLAALVEQSGCGLLIDVNNIYVSAQNLGFDASAYVDALPHAQIGEIHLAGHSPDGNDSDLLIDNHGAPVAEAVWQLYRRLLEHTGPRPTLVEWDNDVPDWRVLFAETRKAAAILADVDAPERLPA